MLAESGFGEVEASDVTARVLPSARHIRNFCRVARGLLALRLDRVLWRDAAFRADFRRHVDAGALFSNALIEGPIRIFGYRGRRPVRT